MSWFSDTARYQDGNGLRWDVIRADYLERCNPEERHAMLTGSPFDEKGSLRGRVHQRPLINRELPKKSEPREGGGVSPTGIRTNPAKEQAVADLYVKDGNSPANIGLELGLHRATVRRILLEKTNYDPAEWTGSTHRTPPAFK